MAAAKLGTKVWRSAGGWGYQIGSGEGMVTGWSRSRPKISQLAEGYLRRRGGELPKDDKGRVLINVSGSPPGRRAE